MPEHSANRSRHPLCRTTVGGTDRRYVSAEGPVSIEQPVICRAPDALHLRYGYDREELDPTEFANSVMLVLRPERWIAWSDAD